VVIFHPETVWWIEADDIWSLMPLDLDSNSHQQLHTSFKPISLFCFPCTFRLVGAPHNYPSSTEEKDMHRMSGGCLCELLHEQKVAGDG